MGLNENDVSNEFSTYILHDDTNEKHFIQYNPTIQSF